MPISAETRRQVHTLATTVGTRVDDTTRTLTDTWVRAWDALTPLWIVALETAATAAASAAAGGWLPPWLLYRIPALTTALRRTSSTLADLTATTTTVIGDAVSPIVTATADAQPNILASQLPPHTADNARTVYAARIQPTPLTLMIARTRQRITSQATPLSRDAEAAIRHALIRGVITGDNPNTVARRMLALVEGAFNGGLGRAIVIARTELLDVHREAARYAQDANNDVLAGWTWHAHLDTNTCVACWVMHGRVFPLSEPGPLDHPQGRCTRIPTLRPWAELGFPDVEPADATPDGRAVFDTLDRASQLAILGPARLALLEAGRIAWEDLAYLKPNPGWRPAYTPTPLRRLQPPRTP